MADDDKPASDGEQQGPRKFTFPAHKSHLLTLARLCQENRDFTDCLIQFDKDGEDGLRAHRMILGSASPFLKSLFSDLPPSLHEATVLVPGVKRRVVSALLDFLYTGEMTVDRSDTADLQRLIETLQINPELISVDVVDNGAAENDENVENGGESNEKVGQNDKKVDESSEKVDESDKKVDGNCEKVDENGDCKEKAEEDAEKVGETGSGEGDAEAVSGSSPGHRKRKLSADSDDDESGKKSKC